MEISTGLTAALAVLLLAGVPAMAQQASIQGDIEIAVSAIGTATSRADILTVTVPIETAAASPAGARASNATRITQFKAAMAAAGIPAEAVRAIHPRGPMGFVGNERYGDQATLPDLSPVDTRATAHSSYKMTIRTQAQLDAVQNALDDLKLSMMTGPVAELDDDKPARAKALGDAVNEARWQADAIANASGLRIIGIKILRSPCQEAFVESFQQDISRILAKAKGSEDLWAVETSVGVCVTYIARSGSR